MINKSQFEKDLKNAYRKWKSAAYYDKYLVIDVDRLAQFESKEGLLNYCESEGEEDFFSNLADKLINDDKRKEYIHNLVADVKVRCFPKISNSMGDKEEQGGNNKNDIVIQNKYNEKIKPINSVQYMIDLPVEAHILGVLWILKFGIYLDEKLIDHCFGNRIRKSELKRIEKNSNTSPFLFYPYFKKYSSWRDGAFDVIENVLEQDKDAVMISMDIRSYFYNCRIDFRELKEHCKELIKPWDEEFDFLFDFLSLVFRRYSNHFFIDDEEYNEDPFIPIGFLPSNIIANWYLSKFDQEILEKIKPDYYARYVDDILFVFSSQSETLLKDEILKKFLLINATNVSADCKRLDGSYINPIKVVTDGKEEKYYIPVELLPNEEKPLYFGEEKIKIYYFSQSNSRELLNQVRGKLEEQSSFFQYLLESDEFILENFYEKIQQISYTDGPNKPRSIDGIYLDKYELSKWMSFLLYFSGKISPDDYFRFKNVLFDTLSESGAFKFIILWQKYLSIFYKYEDYEAILRFVNTILNQIAEAKVVVKDKPNFVVSINCESDIRLTLVEYLICCLRRTLCLRKDDKVDKLIDTLNKRIDNLIDHLEDVEDVKTKNLKIQSLDFESYLQSYLFDLRLTPYSLAKFTKENQQFVAESDYDIFNLKQKIYSFFCVKNGDIKAPTNYLLFYPRFIYFNEIILLLLRFPIVSIENLVTSQNKKITNEGEIQKRLVYSNVFRIFYWVNFGDDSVIDKFYIPNPYKNFDDEYYNELFDFSSLKKGDIEALKIRIGRTQNREKIRIGIANVRIHKNSLVNNLLRKENDSSIRRNDVTKIINDAIDNKVELLVLPECYVNYEWMHKLIRISKDNQMGIVFGLEHIVDEDSGYVYNYLVTLLPFKINRFNYCAIDIRIKNHYSPRERQVIEDFGYKIPDHLDGRTFSQYCLFDWKGLSFAPYCCYEIADISHRAIFKNLLDAIVVVEWNKDIEYFSAIVESLSRDLHCYTIQVNSSDYGDNRITQPASSFLKDIVKAKGGRKAYLIVEDIDIQELRYFQQLGYQLQVEYSDLHDGKFKPTPPGFDRELVYKRDDYEGKK